MKKILLFLSLSLFFGFTSWAQDSDESEMPTFNSIVMEDVIDGIYDRNFDDIPINEKPTDDENSEVVDEDVLNDKENRVDEDVLNDIMLFPNPVESDVTISFKANQVFDYEVNVVNMNQELLMRSRHTSKLGNNVTLYNFSRLRTGAYYVVISSEKGRLFKKLIIKL